MSSSQGDARSTDPFMGPLVLALMVLAYVVVGRAAGLAWKTLLHWAGESLLIVGILLAAKGISDVRREWTGLPGIWGTAKQKAHLVRARATSLMWAGWNRIVRWGWLAKRLNLRSHGRSVVAVSGAATATASASAAADVIWGPPTVTGTTEERLAWLEGHMVSAGARLRELDVWRQHESADRKAAAAEERLARAAEDQRIREDMADLAGGGLRLQAWGVVCLLAGTIMTAIW
jgi:hypothetical protein